MLLRVLGEGTAGVLQPRGARSGTLVDRGRVVRVKTVFEGDQPLNIATGVGKAGIGRGQRLTGQVFAEDYAAGAAGVWAFRSQGGCAMLDAVSCWVVVLGGDSS